MSNISSVLSTRPEWTKSTTGIPIDCVVRIHGGSMVGGKHDITQSRTRVSLIKPGGLQSKPEDEYDVGYVYGSEATNADVSSRSVSPLVKKFLEGYNVAVIMFGATDSGKTTTLEGPRGKDTKTTADGDGIVHLAIDELFKQLSNKAVAVGDIVAQKRRVPSAKAYDFFVESTFVEVYNETCHDLYQKGAAVQAALPVYEDEMEGYQVASLTTLMAKNEGEMRTNFNMGRMNRDTQMTDQGSVHERAAAIFTIHLAQYAPAALPGEEDRVMVSKFQFVDMPGCERLGMDPELLRLREGPQLNRGLLSFASTLNTLATHGSSHFVNYEESMLMRLLADAVGGNSLSLLIGTIRQGSYELNSTTMKYVHTAKSAKNYPIINHGRARGLLLKLRHRLLSILADRDTLRDQMNELPADGDPNAIAISIARVRDLEARLHAEREEKATLMEEKQALQARLMKLRDAGTDDLKEKADLQEALIRSEELRLALAKTLIDAQMDYNEKEGMWAEEKLELEKKLAEYEASHMEQYVKADDHAGLVQNRDDLNAALRTAQEELQRKTKHLEELEREVRKLNQELNMVGGEPGAHEAHLEAGGLAALEEENIDPNSVEGKRRLLFIKLRAKDRRIAELVSEMKELQKEVDRLRNKQTLTRTGVDEVREAYRRKLEVNMRDISDMSRAVAIMQDDPNSKLRVTPEDLFNTFQKLTDENIKVTEEREREMRRDLDDLHTRHVELKRKFRSLYLAYRQLRYLIEDKWPTGPGLAAPPTVPTEDEVLGVAFEEVNRSEEEADRRLIARLRERSAQLDSQLRALKIADAAGQQGITLKATNYSQLPREHQFESDKYVDMPEMLKFENEKLRSELDRMKKAAGAGGPTNEKLLQENALMAAQLQTLRGDKDRFQLSAELATTRAELDKLRKTGGPGGGSLTDAASVQQTVKDFSNKTQAELERRLMNAEAKRVMAEEQLESLQKYITQASVQYQREIVRLRAVIGQVDPRMLKANPIRGA